MALTPALVRSDRFLGNKKLNCGPGSKPCGNACIPRNHKCRASWNKPVKAAATVGAIGGAALLGTALLHPRPNMRRAAMGMVEPIRQGAYAAGNAARGNWGGAAMNMANMAASSQGLGRNARTVVSGYGADIQNLYRRGKEAAFKAKNHRQAKGGRVPGLNYDSVWASGFAP
jgi:hypothetical protein